MRFFRNFEFFLKFRGLIFEQNKLWKAKKMKPEIFGNFLHFGQGNFGKIEDFGLEF